MAYSEGDRLLFKSESGKYSTIVTDVLTSSKTITFKFVACTDADNNNYTVVQIGSQIWMAENLKTTKYNDGISIPLVTDKAAWTNLNTPGCCWYSNDSSLYNIYGLLYNWYTVNTGKLAPVGWHVPTDVEWTTLTSNLGESNAGDKLKESGTTHWAQPNRTATNESGFTALPGGQREWNGNFFNLGTNGGWWSSTPYYLNGYAWLRMMYYASIEVLRYNDQVVRAFNVRCVKD
jgi:uncharacterized protein (TIGR02145 family)